MCESMNELISESLRRYGKAKTNVASLLFIDLLLQLTLLEILLLFPLVN